jgi:predicted kinase
MSGPVVMVTGPPCSGKTSIARPLAALLGVPLLSRDTIRAELAASGDQPNPEQSDHVVSGMLLGHLQGTLGGSGGVVVDACLSVAEIIDIAAVVAASWRTVVTVYARAPLGVLMERMDNGDSTESARREATRWLLRPVVRDLETIPGTFLDVDTSGRMTRDIVPGLVERIVRHVETETPPHGGTK